MIKTILFLGQFKKILQMIIYEKWGSVVCQPPKNLKISKEKVEKIGVYN